MSLCDASFRLIASINLSTHTESHNKMLSNFTGVDHPNTYNFIGKLPAGKGFCFLCLPCHSPVASLWGIRIHFLLVLQLHWLPWRLMLMQMQWL